VQSIPVFSVGKKTASDGRSFSLSEADLRLIAAAANGLQVPFVPGHPVDNQPELGFAQGWLVEDGFLRTGWRDLDPAFEAIVRSGELNRVSIKFYLPGHPKNPRDFPIPAHVGFLGRSEPADRRLGDVQFSVNPFEAIFMGTEIKDGAAEVAQREAEFAQREAGLAQREAEFAQREAEFAQREAAQFVAERIAGGTLIPGLKEQAIALLAALPALPEIQFSGKATQPQQLFRDFLAALPKAIEFGESAPAAAAPETGDPMHQAMQFARQISDYRDTEAAKGRAVSYADAAAAVKAQQKG
jgi:hypothetical protein